MRARFAGAAAGSSGAIGLMLRIRDRVHVRRLGGLGRITRAAKTVDGCVPDHAQIFPDLDNGSDGDVAKCSSIVIEHEKSTRHLPNSRQRPSLGMSLGHAQINMRPVCTR